LFLDVFECPRDTERVPIVVILVVMVSMQR
jgi:hypothetical protein